MTTTRGRWFIPRRTAAPKGPAAADPPRTQAAAPQDPGPLTPLAPVAVADCLRACAVLGGALAAAPGDRYPELARRLDRLPALKESAPGGPASGELLDALLDAGAKAVEADAGGHRLALLVTDTVLPLRADSRPGWRLRARALEAVGDLPGALDAYERFLAMGGPDAVAAARVAALRVALPKQRELAAVLERTAPLPRTGHPVQVLEEAALRHIAERLAPGGEPAEPAELARVIGLYADQHRHRLRSPVPDPTYGGTRWVGLGELRNLITGRSLCLVANSETVRDGCLGKLIDSYDLVVRFTSYVIEPAATGTRTDVHVTGHRRIFNWERPVTTRLVLGEKSADWRTAVRNRLVPGAQRYAGDETLRAPVRGIGRLGTDAWPHPPTSAFEAMWLIDFLDVSPRFDLVGFDFHRTGSYRMPNAREIATGSAAQHADQKAWVMERAQHVAGPVISLR